MPKSLCNQPITILTPNITIHSGIERSSHCNIHRSREGLQRNTERNSTNFCCIDKNFLTQIFSEILRLLAGQDRTNVAR
ncbi:hypothetical protein H6G01_19840 [Leptolyngbya sp. FACHB-17]|nr:hypothetical protein [Leptolyngbya sp. FACHB-17]